MKIFFLSALALLAIQGQDASAIASDVYSKDILDSADLELIDAGTSRIRYCRFDDKTRQQSGCSNGEYCELEYGTCPKKKGIQRGRCVSTNIADCFSTGQQGKFFQYSSAIFDLKDKTEFIFMYYCTKSAGVMGGRLTQMPAKRWRME